ncbi:hypothetical protein FNF29_05606 [Cafeteria roenbergensis]|uniref:PNPLA domain-containing protein n=1 Tax=Cafeteria roenbergensis TaxID=33653 RepID=A0A5A8CA36_CAFRO|nr:hypothetical protein FNF29_05606 [Cafeteria roenbergensis]|eukprot:KAA0149986.1 hypothetical protein FNF29_05606 [Cafeteria roenbergensis]
MSIRFLGVLAAMPVWVLGSVLLSALQLGLVVYNAGRIAVDLCFFWLAGVLRRVVMWVNSPWSFGSHRRRMEALERSLYAARTREEWTAAATLIDKAEGAEGWRSEVESSDYDYRLVEQMLRSLKEARLAGDTHELMFLLGSALHRRFGSIDRSCLYHRARAGTKRLVERFVDECVLAINAVAQAPTGAHSAISPTKGGPADGSGTRAPDPGPGSPTNSAASAAAAPSHLSASDKLEFFEGARLAMGRTALCLSGGGALAMYHMGVVRALIQADAMPRIVSGTSGGAIVAGMLAIRTDKEMVDDVIASDIADRYGVTWFDPIPTQVATFAASLLTSDRPHTMRSERFAATCKRYFGAYTFGEAFRRTGRVVSIVITVRYGDGGASHPFLANYLTCPTVFIWSAVAASCALPGLMPAANLAGMSARTAGGDALGPLDGVPFHPRGVHALDGSMQSDIPGEALARLFHVNRFVTSQVRLWLTLDIQYRAHRLARLRLLPRFFGADVSGIFTQRYRGHVTISPRMSLLDQFKALSHPSRQDMERYISEGELATWPRLAHIATTA